MIGRRNCFAKCNEKISTMQLKILMILVIKNFVYKYIGYLELQNNNYLYCCSELNNGTVSTRR